MRRVLAAIGVCALSLVVAVPGVAAAGPSRVPLEIPASFTLDPGASCAFAVQIDVLLNREYTMDFADASGNVYRELIDGSLVIRVSNPSNRASMTLNIGGPGDNQFYPDGSATFIQRGRSLFWEPGRLDLATGTLVIQVGSDGTIANDPEATGTNDELCAALA